MEENSIEKDMKRLERISEYFNYSMWEDDINALRHILSDYKNIKRKLGYISEICVENSKQHIDDRQSIAKIIKILQK